MFVYVCMYRPEFEMLCEFNLLCMHVLYAFSVFLHCDVLVNRVGNCCGINFVALICSIDYSDEDLLAFSLNPQEQINF